MNEPFKLVYWPKLPGRGDFARYILEDAGASYVDLARLPADQGGGMDAVMAYYRGRAAGMPVFAPPILVHGELVLSQTTAICHYLGDTLGLQPAGPGTSFQALQAMMTVADVITEVHDTHHPVAMYQTYEQQKDAAVPRAAFFLQSRLPKYADHFEAIIAAHGGPWLFGHAPCYVDLALAQLLRGLEYAFPKNYARVIGPRAALVTLRAAVEQRPRIAAYLASDRSLPFAENGIFRRYPELDVTPTGAA